MSIGRLYEAYESLAAGADAAFRRMHEEYARCIRCRRACSDCCSAVFGLFPIEAAYLKARFDNLPRKLRRAAWMRAEKADRDLIRLGDRLKAAPKDPEANLHVLARERVRCPLLDEGRECILYAYRPVTCRIYGIPTLIQGKVRVCGQSGFAKGTAYPVFDLDMVYGELHALSGELLKAMASPDLSKASLLYAVSKVIRTPVRELIKEGSE